MNEDERHVFIDREWEDDLIRHAPGTGSYISKVEPHLADCDMVVLGHVAAFERATEIRATSDPLASACSCGLWHSIWLKRLLIAQGKGEVPAVGIDYAFDTRVAVLGNKAGKYNEGRAEAGE